ncbi:ATP-binding cassette domain-containing protein [Yoonia sp.]|nr:ATP-binding cassette domain-containing protein [Yoonia sp.]
MPPLLTCPQLSTTLDTKDGVFQLIAHGFCVDPGQSVALTGASGSGKSLFLELAALIRKPDPESLFGVQIGDAEGVDISALWQAPNGEAKLAGIRRKHLGFVPQSGELLPFLSVMDNIKLGQKMNGQPDESVVDHLITRLDLTQEVAKPLAQLSIGQRQRLSIARALAHRPSLVLADEPTAALDPARSEAVIALFLDLAAELNTAVVVSTHDMKIASLPSFTRWICDVTMADTVTKSTLRKVVA